MKHKNYSCPGLLSMVNKVNRIKHHCQFLDIALELIENPDDDTLGRVELLIKTFLQHSECYFEYIEKSEEIRSLCNNQSTSE